ncbi:hypothetical protein X772_33810 [Mesorhizobium sp. LSJC280B00]|nr:hypothetical protein X772_33810 [Mesorhizobium sp. LSJC280B00]
MKHGPKRAGQRPATVDQSKMLWPGCAWTPNDLFVHVELFRIELLFGQLTRRMAAHPFVLRRFGVADPPQVRHMNLRLNRPAVVACAPARAHMLDVVFEIFRGCSTVHGFDSTKG